MLVKIGTLWRRLPRSSFRLLTSSHPDWDLKALNDEMEGLIGKFEDISDDRGSGIINSTTPSTPRSVSTRAQTDTANSSISPINIKATIHPPTKEKKSQNHSSQIYSKPSYCIFHINEHTQEYLSDEANLSHKYWHHFTSLDLLMEELADDNHDGVIILYNQLLPSGEIITPAQKNLLKIYKKSSSVVLVVDKNFVANSLSDGGQSSDTSFASCVIQGFDLKDGVAAAIAGMRNSHTLE